MKVQVITDVFNPLLRDMDLDVNDHEIYVLEDICLELLPVAINYHINVYLDKEYR